VRNQFERVERGSDHGREGIALDPGASSIPDVPKSEFTR